MDEMSRHPRRELRERAAAAARRQAGAEPGDVARASEWRAPPTVVRRVDEMIERAMRDLDALVCVRADLTGEDPFGDRRRAQEDEAELRRRVAEAAARDPQRAAETRAQTRDMLERLRRAHGDTDTGPPSAVRFATGLVRQWRQVRREETAVLRTLVDRTLGRGHDRVQPTGEADT
jgi:hypothetical protein